jgi:hypothetical protein
LCRRSWSRNCGRNSGSSYLFKPAVRSLHASTTGWKIWAILSSAGIHFKTRYVFLYKILVLFTYWVSPPFNVHCCAIRLLTPTRNWIAWPTTRTSSSSSAKAIGEIGAPGVNEVWYNNPSINSGVSAPTAACRGVSERIRLFYYLQNRDPLQISIQTFTSLQGASIITIKRRGWGNACAK